MKIFRDFQDKLLQNDRKKVKFEDAFTYEEIEL